MTLTGHEPYDPLSEASRLWGAYVYLRDNDMRSVSETSRLLHEAEPAYLRSRLAQELRELAGVMTGAHRHAGLFDDVILEGSQVCYWAYILALRTNLSIPDFGYPLDTWILAPGSSEISALHLAEQLTQIAAGLGAQREKHEDLLPQLREAFRSVGQCCAAVGIDAQEIIRYDLNQLEQRTYLSAYFSAM